MAYDTRLSQLVKHIASQRIEEAKDTMSKGMMDERTYRYTAGRIKGLQEITDLFDEAEKQIEGREDN